MLFLTIDASLIREYKLYRYDNYSHFLMYTIFSFISSGIFFKSRNILFLFFMLIFPFATEYIQYFYPTRSVDIKDLYNNYYGLVFGILLFTIFKYVKKTKYFKSCNN